MAGYQDTPQIPACFVLCGHCLTEQWVAGNEIGRCICCRNFIFPCGACDTERDGCGWDKDAGCRKFPGVKTPIMIGATVVGKDGCEGTVEDYDFEDDIQNLEHFRAYAVSFSGSDVWDTCYPQDIKEVL